MSEGLSDGDGVSIVVLEGNSGEDSLGSELVDAVADVLTGRGGDVGLADTISLFTTVMSSHSVDTDLLSHVDLVCNGGGTDVEPVSIIGSEFLADTGFDVVSPLINI